MYVLCIGSIGIDRSRSIDGGLGEEGAGGGGPWRGKETHTYLGRKCCFRFIFAYVQIKRVASRRREIINYGPSVVVASVDRRRAGQRPQPSQRSVCSDRVAIALPQNARYSKNLSIIAPPRGSLANK